MGLCLIVGILAELDEDEVREFQTHFANVNRALRASGLPEHHEPLDLGDADPLSLDMYGYSGLHYLRRIAAHLWAGNPMPPPGDRDSIKEANDAVIKRYYFSLDQSMKATKPGLLRRARPEKAPSFAFEHLMAHSDAEGFYVPIEFDRVIVDTGGFGIPGGMLGSTQKLKLECETLARFLGLSLDLDPESEELWTATEHQGEGETQWEKYGVESFTCSRLFHACNASIQHRAALTFS